MKKSLSSAMSPRIQRGSTLSPEKKLRIEYDEERQVIMAKHREELQSMTARCDDEISRTTCGLKQQHEEEIGELKRAVKGLEIEYTSDLERVREERVKEKHAFEERLELLEKKLNQSRREFDLERRQLVSQKQELQVERDSVKEMHQSYVDLYGNILTKKEDSHARQLAELAADQAREKEEALRVVGREKAKLEEQMEREKGVMSQEKQLLSVELQSARHQCEDLRAQLAAREKEHEDFLREHAIKQSDHHTKVALRNLLEEQQEEMAQLETRRQTEIQHARAKLRSLETRYEHNLEKLKEDFEVRLKTEKEQWKANSAALAKVELAELEDKHLSELIEKDKELQTKIEASTRDLRRNLENEKEDKLALQKADFERQISYLSGRFEQQLVEKETELLEEKREYQKMTTSQIIALEDQKHEAMRGWEERVTSLESEIETVKDEKDGVIEQMKLQEAIWRGCYRQVKHLRCVVEAFRPALKRKNDLGATSNSVSSPARSVTTANHSATSNNRMTKKTTSGAHTSAVGAPQQTQLSYNNTSTNRQLGSTTTSQAQRHTSTCGSVAEVDSERMDAAAASSGSFRPSSYCVINLQDKRGGSSVGGVVGRAGPFSGSSASGGSPRAERSLTASRSAAVTSVRSPSTNTGPMRSNKTVVRDELHQDEQQDFGRDRNPTLLEFSPRSRTAISRTPESVRKSNSSTSLYVTASRA
ncbi:unnamed protein product [Amoebophrya sp. A25]|nr:unnamed protein product [Amoebophrya sp. A25]|eukprot:GSA25T00020298001.1